MSHSWSTEILEWSIALILGILLVAATAGVVMLILMCMITIWG